MDFIIREMQAQEYPLLRRFPHQATCLPEGAVPTPLPAADRLTVRMRRRTWF